MEEVILPIGTILPYAGEVVDHLPKEGWLLCDGRSVRIGDHQQLYEAIGNAFGKLSQDEFCLPLLNGAFLRGRQGNAPTRDPGGDPDVATRQPLRSGGNWGNAVGSLQRYATASPRNPFSSEIVSGRIGERGTAGGGDHHVAKYSIESKNVKAERGGDLESRPANKYVHFIIKFEDYTWDGRVVEAPIGALMAFAGTTHSSWQINWKLCDGEPLSNRGVFQPLFDVLRFGNGKKDSSQFYLPDYRGFFLRGVNRGTGFDPEAAARKAPMPGGNGGDAVGSTQADATALPTSGLFLTPYPHLPRDPWLNACGVAPGVGVNVSLWKSTGRHLNLSDSGGDPETRPVNVAVGWYVRFR